MRLIGVRNDTPETRMLGGSASAFDRQGVGYVELFDIGYSGSAIDVSPSYAESLMADFEPDRVLVGCSLDTTGQHFGIEDALLAAATQHSVRSVRIVELWDSWVPRSRPVSPDTYAVLDELTSKVLESRGAATGLSAVTGNPGFDMFADGSLVGRSELRAQLGLGDERLLVFIGQAEVRSNSPDVPKTLGWVVDALSPGDRLAFSRHPRDVRDYTSILDRADERQLTTAMGGNELIYAADVCLTQYSTLGLKAALLGIPTINILLDDDWPDIREIAGGYPVSLAGGSVEVNTAIQLKHALAKPMRIDGVRLRKALNVDGESTQRVARLLLGD